MIEIEELRAEQSLSISIIYIIYFRINRNESMSPEFSPTPEGVHQDNTEIREVLIY